jgi:predicted nucleic acid-binding protein
MTRSPAVIDAGVAVLRVLNTPARDMAVALWDRFLQEAIVLSAPRLWSYEITSTIHKYVFDQVLTVADGQDALRIMFAFGVNLIAEDESLCLSAFAWATRLNHRPAYDAFYLALAEKLNADFWTADRRLCNNAKGMGIDWIHFIGETEER